MEQAPGGTDSDLHPPGIVLLYKPDLFEEIRKGRLKMADFDKAAGDMDKKARQDLLGDLIKKYFKPSEYMEIPNGTEIEVESASIDGGNGYTRRKVLFRGATPDEVWDDVEAWQDTENGDAEPKKISPVSESKKNEDKRFGYGDISSTIDVVGDSSFSRGLFDGSRFFIIKKDTDKAYEKLTKDLKDRGIDVGHWINGKAEGLLFNNHYIDPEIEAKQNSLREGKAYDPENSMSKADIFKQMMSGGKGNE
jgi:hypothetical protein